MDSSPYRQPSAPGAAGEAESHAPDTDLLPVAVVLWIACAVRVGVVLARRETFGLDASLAAIVAALLPIVFVRWIARWVRHR